MLMFVLIRGVLLIIRRHTYLRLFVFAPLGHMDFPTKTQVLFAYRMCTGELAGPAGKLAQSLNTSPLLQNTDPWDILSTLRPLKAKVWAPLLKFVAVLMKRAGARRSCCMSRKHALQILRPYRGIPLPGAVQAKEAAKYQLWTAPIALARKCCDPSRAVGTLRSVDE